MPGEFTIDLAGFAPHRCERGHPMGAGQRLVGFAHCDCDSTRRRAGARGHNTVQCAACLAERVDLIYYGPIKCARRDQPEIIDRRGLTKTRPKPPS